LSGPARRQSKRRKAAARRALPASAAVAADAPVAATPADIGVPAIGIGGSWAQRVSALVAHRAFPVAALACIWVLSTVGYVLLGRQHPIPDLIPDEIFYGKLAQGLAYGQGLHWRGSSWGLPPLWPSVLSLAWRGTTPAHGYEVAKVMGAALASTTIVPVWLLARSLAGPRLALIPALLVVLGPWMIVTEFIASENLAFPLATASLACTVAAVRETRSRWILLSLGFGAIAGLTRFQLLALPVILVLALILDVLRQPAGARRARIQARPRALWIGLLVIVGGGVLAFVVKPDLTQYAVLAHDTSAWDVTKTAGRHGLFAIALFAFIPVAATGALMARKENWRSDVTGPLLVTVAAAVAVLFPLLARFEAWATAGAPVDRYTMYLAPLLLTLLVLAPGRVSRRSALIAAGVLVGLMVLTPIATNWIEQPGVFGLQQRLYKTLGLFKDHPKLSVPFVALLVTPGAMFALTARTRRTLGLALSVAAVATVMLVQLATAASFENSRIKQIQPLVTPPTADWVDASAHGPVAILSVGRLLPWRSNADIYTEFFNRDVRWYYSTIAAGNNSCDVDLTSSGFLKVSAPACPKWPRQWVVSGGPVKTTLYGQRTVSRTTNGTLIRTPAGTPRVMSLVEAPCNTYVGCIGQLGLALYLDHPARVAVTFSAAPTEHRVQTGNQIQVLAPNRPTTLRFNLPAGAQAVNIPVDWRDARGAPALQSVFFKTKGQTYRAY
jgi:hypothetical protein